MSLFSELRRRNVHRMALLYLGAAWLIMQVVDLLIDRGPLPESIGPITLTVLAIGFPIALIISWFYELTPEGISLDTDEELAESATGFTGRRVDFVIISLLAAAVLVFAYDKWWTSGPPEHSIAVLPFENMSDDPGQEYFSDGISEELLNLLAKIPELSVISRTSAFSYKGKDIRLSEIARELNVAHVLEGSVRKAGNTVRITAQLIDVRTDTHLWSESYDRELEDIFAVQDEISGHIVRALKVTLGAGKQEVMAPAQKPTEDLEAYDQYLRGRYFWQRRGEGNIRQAIELFERATALDPQFARAWSSLATAHATLWFYSDVTKAEGYPLAVSAAHKALALDDTLAEAYAVLGEAAYLLDRKWSEGEAYFLRAIANEPKNATIHHWYSDLLGQVGRHREGLKECLIAYQLDPVNPPTIATLVRHYSILNDTSNVQIYGAIAWDLGRGDGLYELIWAHVRLEEFDRAIDLAEQFDEFAKLPLSPTTLFVEAMRDAAKRPLFLKMLAEHESTLPYYISILGYVTFGRIDDAYRLANLFPRGPLQLYWRPEMAPFRRDPRFENLVTELGLLDYWHENGWPDACLPEGNSLSCE